MHASAKKIPGYKKMKSGVSLRRARSILVLTTRVWKNDYTECLPEKSTTYISHEVPTTTHTHDRLQPIGKKNEEERKENERKERKEREKGKGNIHGPKSAICVLRYHISPNLWPTPHLLLTNYDTLHSEDNKVATEGKRKRLAPKSNGRGRLVD